MLIETLVVGVGAAIAILSQKPLLNKYVSDKPMLFIKTISTILKFVGRK